MLNDSNEEYKKIANAERSLIWSHFKMLYVNGYYFLESI